MELLLPGAGVTLPTGHLANHTFACYYQIVRAFHRIFEQIIGAPSPQPAFAPRFGNPSSHTIFAGIAALCSTA